MASSAAEGRAPAGAGGEVLAGAPREGAGAPRAGGDALLRRVLRRVAPFTGVAVACSVFGLGAVVTRARYQVLHVSHMHVPVPPHVTELPFQLVESAGEMGLDFTQQKLVPHASLGNVAPMIAALAGASVAVVDFDGDGYPDIYLTNQALHGKNALFRNNHDGTFTDVAGKAGLADVNQRAGSLRALFFDYDNDGKQDLLLSTTWCPRVFHNRGDGTFEEVTARAGIDHCGFGFASNAIDYDGDGYLDLVMGDFLKPVDVFHPSTTKLLWNGLYSADNGGPIVVYHNERNGTFSRVPDSLGIRSRGFSHAIGVYDFFGTGAQDLYIATDFGIDQIYLQETPGRFTDVSARIKDKYSRSGMNAEIADVDGDGHPLVFVTEGNDPGHAENLNTLWKVEADGTFRDVTGARGLPPCGWAWGGKFVDLDNDGALDLVVTNGWISQGTQREQYWTLLARLEGSNKALIEDARNWPEMGDRSWAGYEQKCAFYNLGGRFVDATALTDLKDDFSDGRGLAAIDYLNTGTMSLVEATVGSRVRFYKNLPRDKRHWIGFDLVGTRSNRDAFGARVVVEAGGRRQTREVHPANGFQAQSDHRLHFGLGALASVEGVTIRWPSGASQRLSGLDVDHYYRIVEPDGG